MDNLTVSLPLQAWQQLLQILRSTPLPFDVSSPLLNGIGMQVQDQVKALQQPQEVTLEQAPPPNRAARRAKGR